MTKPKHNPVEILLTPMENNDIDAPTVGRYIFGIASSVFEQGEGFSGKRPWGNSDWEDVLQRSLILNGHLRGELDEYGYIEDYDRKEYREILKTVFEFLNNADLSTISLPPEPKDHILVKVDATDPLNPKVLDSYSEAMTLEDAENIRKTEPYFSPYIQWHILKVPV